MINHDLVGVVLAVAASPYPFQPVPGTSFRST